MTAVQGEIAASLELRPYRARDEDAILRLFESCYGRDLPRDYWRWRYLENPAGGPWIELAWDRDRLVAHHAVSATTLSMAGRPIPAGLSMATMTDPDYRGCGLLPLLGQRLYARLAEAGVTLVYGFPNASSHRAFVGELGWRDIYEVPTLRLPLAAARRLDAAPAAVCAVSRPDPRFDRLWERMRGRFTVWVCRDAKHLAWRFSDCPASNYSIAAWEERDEIRGYAVVKRYQQESLDLVDLIAENDIVARGLLAWALGEARKAALPAIATWCSPHAPWRLVLEDAGFGAGAPVTFMGTRVFARSASIAEASRAWGFSMLDSGAY